jgi:hypothetical protein
LLRRAEFDVIWYRYTWTFRSVDPLDGAVGRPNFKSTLLLTALSAALWTMSPKVAVTVAIAR